MKDDARGNECSRISRPGFFCCRKLNEFAELPIIAFEKSGVGEVAVRIRMMRYVWSSECSRDSNSAAGSDGA